MTVLIGLGIATNGKILVVEGQVVQRFQARKNAGLAELAELADACEENKAQAGVSILEHPIKPGSSDRMMAESPMSGRASRMGLSYSSIRAATVFLVLFLQANQIYWKKRRKRHGKKNSGT